ncbi:hypothetical protein niasHT_003197 [Heterodera trifolii]|uniref:Uncharacterized protein n=1 Tax=Heterodera trifolii TaxID=157864 RepID=A0ABD2LNZ5_9BILA
MDKKSLTSQLLPTVNFLVTTQGVTVHSDRLDTPRVVFFNDDGTICRQCRYNMDLDYLISKDGVYIQSNRLKGTEKFVPFDRVYDLPRFCAFRVRSRRIFKVPYIFSDSPIEKSISSTVTTENPLIDKIEPKKARFDSDSRDTTTKNDEAEKAELTNRTDELNVVEKATDGVIWTVNMDLSQVQLMDEANTTENTSKLRTNKFISNLDTIKEEKDI